MKHPKDIILVAISASFITICSWIAIPFTISFTLQTLAITLILSLIGAKKGTIAIAVYLFIGAIGVPVFSGFKGGLMALVGPTGGYLVGFLLWGALLILLEKISDKLVITIICHFFGLIMCYTLGTIWFSIIMKTSIITSLSICVAPFVIFDIIKIILGVAIASKLKKIIDKKNIS